MEQRVKNEYAGIIELVLEQKDNRTITSKKYYEGLVKVSANIRNDREKIPTYYLLQLGGGYIEGEKYKNIFRIKDNTRAIITTQASTKVYKCEHGNVVTQETTIDLGENSVLEYITDTVILYKNAMYKQVNNIYLKDTSTLIYSDGITAGWSPEGEKFTYKKVQLKSNVYINNKIVLLDNLIVNPRENDVTKLGFFEEYLNFGTLLIINKNINSNVIEELRKDLEKIELPIDFGISELEVNGFVLRVLGNLTQNIEFAMSVCHNYIRKNFLGSKNLVMRKY